MQCVLSTVFIEIAATVGKKLEWEKERCCWFENLIAKAALV